MLDDATLDGTEEGAERRSLSRKFQDAMTRSVQYEQAILEWYEVEVLKEAFCVAHPEPCAECTPDIAAVWSALVVRSTAAHQKLCETAKQIHELRKT